MKENNFQRILVKSLRECGAVVFNIHGHAMQVAGIPDLYIAHPVWTGWLELKTGNNPATKLQSSTLKRLIDCGVHAYILVANKPRMVLKCYDGEIIGYIPFMTNDIDGIAFLNKLHLTIKSYELQLVANVVEG